MKFISSLIFFLENDGSLTFVAWLSAAQVAEFVAFWDQYEYKGGLKFY